MTPRTIAELIFLSGIESVLPGRLVRENISLKDNILIAGKVSFPLDRIKNIYIIGAGKAGAMMAAETEKIMGERITGGHVVVKYGYSCRLKRIKITEAGHPVPDPKGLKATRAIVDIAQKAGEDDLVISLISGGGSALLIDYPEGSSLEEMISINGMLINSGACITEINAVRKHLSDIKGGQLARIAYPASMINLIISDVPGDPLDVIASGPTIPDTTTYEQAISVLEKYNLLGKIPGNCYRHLMKGSEGSRDETPDERDDAFRKTYNLLIGNNMMALEAAREKAMEFNINPVIIDYQLQGDSSSVAEYIVETAKRFRDDSNEVKPVCLLLGGETTVKMTGRGSGGRNQHLALLTAVLLKDHPGITVLCGGTDGSDGPTNAAGAVVDADTIGKAATRHINYRKYIDRFDSYNFFRKAGGHIITGPTMTNVMDIIVIIVE